MMRWIATAVVLTALVGATALAADARIREWTVIGDGYVPRATTAPADAPAPARMNETDGPRCGPEDGCASGEARATASQAAMPEAARSHDGCPDDGCETPAPTQLLVVGDGYAPTDPGGGAPRMLCC